MVSDPKLTAWQLLEANMRLKLFGPDYKDKDPRQALEDFRLRVKAYESAYEPLGQWEEENDLQYIQVCHAKAFKLQVHLH
jgi:hypothetical protein